MITYYLNRFIHSIIRENRLIYIMEMMITKKKKDILLKDFISQLERFLVKEHSILFDDTKLKYMIFLEDFKDNVKKMWDLKKSDDIEANEVLFKLYEIPKKRNNLLLVYLLYFYIKNKERLWWKEIFRIIYIYLMIIVYRNRLTDSQRNTILSINKKRFVAIRDLLEARISILKRRLNPNLKQWLRYAVIPAMIAVLASIFYMYAPNNAIKSNILEWKTSETFWKAAFDSVMIWRVSDPLMKNISDIWFQNIVLMIMFIMLVQALKTSLSTVFFNSLLSKIFSFIWLIIKYISRIVFYIYDYIVYKLETRLIFSFINAFASRWIMPWPFMMSLFSLMYALVYIFAVFLYVSLFVWLFSVKISSLYIFWIWILTSMLVIYINFHQDLNNFKTFMIEIDSIIKWIYTKGTKEPKKA